MSDMDPDNLPSLLNTVHESQASWTTQNWNHTLLQHSQELEELLEMIRILDIWQNGLSDDTVSQRMIPEIFTDLFASVHLASWGLYKYAHMCLRAGLETTLRLIYFSTHPTEYQWWQEGSEWYREGGVRAQDVWGPGYRYFEMLDSIKRFDSALDDGGTLFAEVRRVYSTFSRHIHSGAAYFQTRPDRISPKYDRERFERWLNDAKRLCTLINILLVLGFPRTFAEFRREDRTSIIEGGIGDQDYREKVTEVVDELSGQTP